MTKMLCNKLVKLMIQRLTKCLKTHKKTEPIHEPTKWIPKRISEHIFMVLGFIQMYTAYRFKITPHTLSITHTVIIYNFFHYLLP